MWRIIKQTRARIDSGQGTEAAKPKNRPLFQEWILKSPTATNGIDYPDAGQHSSRSRAMNYEALGPLRPEMFLKSNRSSHSSDTSSAYSGSDTMHSVQSSLDAEEVDLTGLVESVVDSDEDDDCAESLDSMTVRDTVRECLEKDPSERTDEDIDQLLELTQHLKAFTNMTLAVRRALCMVMVFAVVEKAGTIVMNDGEELDSWSVLINGHVEVELSSKETQQLHMGDCFGITPTMEKLYHRGVMKTKCDDCQFVCITQEAYYRIQHQGEENIRRHEEDGEVVLVTEQRVIEGGNRRGHIAIRGTPARLMQHLIEENSIIDPTYVEDFLLTHRTFIESTLSVAHQLLQWFERPESRDKVTRVVLLWVNNHFTDFEMDPSMMEFLEMFEERLEREKMQGQLRLLNIACAAKARTRNVTLARPDRNEILQFSILGGYERGCGIFISKVDKKSKAEEVGLKRGDQIVEVNGQNFEHVAHARALEILRGSTHLSITVRSNLLALKELCQNNESATPRPRTVQRTSELSIPKPNNTVRLSTAFDDSTPIKDHKGHKGGFMTMNTKKRLQKALANFFPRTANEAENHPMGHSLSNPDLVSLCWAEERVDIPEHVLKVYRSDQQCKYLLVHKETTAKEVVMLALHEFGNTTEASSNYNLCEVSVGEGGMIKQRRLLDTLANLAERIGLSSRYYLKVTNSTEPLVPDEMANDLIRESSVNFLQLNAVEVAIQLTLQDFNIFRQIESTEYIDDLFELKSRYGMPMLAKFGELVNREMFWVVTEVCSEHNPLRRMRIIKQFIKVARQCKECKNFNSMFAIISGLGHLSVSRLRSTWERVPGKYQKLFSDLQDLMDPSRNMSKYRQLINSEQSQPPVIPFYPVVKKDLTFIKLGNDSKVEGLVNFEKLRMIAKEVRTLGSMCSSPYDLLTMLELGGQPPSSAMRAMNQMSAGSQHQAATVKRRKKSTAAPNPKKMFEEAQMVRRVKAYLNNLRVITDEERLQQLSLECEPPASAPSSAAPRKRHPSPTLSTTSTTSSTSATRFGAASPQAVRKMLALADSSKTRPHQPPRLLPPSPTGSRKSGHERSHSDTPTAVDLSAESSSVTSLSRANKDSGLSMRESPVSQRRHSTIEPKPMGPPQNPPNRPRRPPEYNEAAKMLRELRLHRAHSHEGVTNSDYNYSDDDEDEGAQVSAV
ncbi:rap guanine nucleotide exchange factor 2 isoform X2 [Neocloeon triangulifer]|uniref:rap guanine nucleotide exchange factor 2 isoform X2 n=1 Tax=Neocloeon triangulifer TaxID=2078957 RepID=UPI00286F43FA|nr:rap guanine nucleotide exchange factor 2 isoform X2 [Neocloeon triangulifer]